MIRFLKNVACGLVVFALASGYASYGQFSPPAFNGQTTIAQGGNTATVNSSGQLSVISPLPTPLTGQQKTTAGSAALPSSTSQNGWIIKASPNNTGVVMVGSGASCPVTSANDGTGNGYPLAPGEAISFAAANLNNACIISASGSTTDFISYAGN